ncbi:hypothetical protein NL676_033006 [Syzygium grande]|nr:hypothetical protein NL676_033006 [Syzygium grande]
MPVVPAPPAQSKVRKISIRIFQNVLSGPSSRLCRLGGWIDGAVEQPRRGWLARRNVAATETRGTRDWEGRTAFARSPAVHTVGRIDRTDDIKIQRFHATRWMLFAGGVLLARRRVGYGGASGIKPTKLRTVGGHGRREDGEAKFPHPTKPATGSTRSSFLCFGLFFLTHAAKFRSPTNAAQHHKAIAAATTTSFPFGSLFGWWRFHRVEFPGRRRPRRSPVCLDSSFQTALLQ